MISTKKYKKNITSVSVGDTLTQADAGSSRTSLSAIKNCEFSEQGAYYVSPSGNVIFKNRSEVIGSAGDTPIEFNPLAWNWFSRSLYVLTLIGLITYAIKEYKCCSIVSSFLQ